jgi:hypothetical protein
MVAAVKGLDGKLSTMVEMTLKGKKHNTAGHVFCKQFVGVRCVAAIALL